MRPYPQMITLKVEHISAVPSSAYQKLIVNRFISIVIYGLVENQMLNLLIKNCIEILEKV